MPVFECPKCQAKMKAADEYAGQTVECPECAAHITVPATAPPPDVSTEAITAEPAAAPPAADPDAITTSEKTASTKKRRREEDRDDDEPRRIDRPADNTGKVLGMTIGMVILITVGIFGCVGVAVVGILVALLVPAIQKVREAAERTQSINNVKQIAIAELGYHDANRKFPSQKLMNMQQGQKHVELSWRVSILPFMDQAPLFNQFDKTNGWDHANNARFQTQRPFAFEHKGRDDPNKAQTRFQLFTGPNTPFPTPETAPMIPQSFPDGVSNTFLFAEAHAPVEWTRPVDMIVGPGALPLPPDRFLAALADGSVRIVMRERTPDATLRLLIDPRDGQALQPNWD